MNAGDIYETNNFGDLEIVSYNGCFDVLVRFVNTGTECVTSSDQIRLGKVKDRFAPIICGVGYIGEKVPHTETIYSRWVNMIKRCYDSKVQEKHPTYIGCTVCDEWLCFSNYHKWFVSNYIDGFEVDKDKKVAGNKVYSPDTCLFISKTENSQLSSSGTYELTMRNGDVIKVENMALFCRENRISQSGITRLKNGERKSCKGFIKVVRVK